MANAVLQYTAVGTANVNTGKFTRKYAPSSPMRIGEMKTRTVCAYFALNCQSGRFMNLHVRQSIGSSVLFNPNWHDPDQYTQVFFVDALQSRMALVWLFSFNCDEKLQVKIHQSLPEGLLRPRA